MAIPCSLEHIKHIGLKYKSITLHNESFEYDSIFQFKKLKP